MCMYIDVYVIHTLVDHIGLYIDSNAKHEELGLKGLAPNSHLSAGSARCALL